MRKSKCLNCGQVFKSKTDKRKHKKEYPNGSCANIELKGGLKMEEKKEEVEEIVEEKPEEEVEEEKETIKQIPKIKMPKEQAKDEWKKYVEVLKKRKENYLKVMKQAMYQMKEGRALLDVYKVMGKAGLNENNEPKLAIARADLKEVRFEKQDEGAGVFDMAGGGYGYKDDVKLPQKTFNIHWAREDGFDESDWHIANKKIKTKVPIVPVELLPEGALSNYYILWETSGWETLPETKDPILLKRISENLFAILGTWDLTELEQAIISGGK